MALKSIDNIPIIDAKHPVVLHITKNDCKNADPKEPASCAAARTIKRELKAIDCRVHLGRIYIRRNEGNWQRYKTPKALRTEIIAFDRGGAFEPGDYELLPCKTNGKSQGTKPKFKHARLNKNRKKRRAPIVVKNVRNGPTT